MRDRQNQYNRTFVGKQLQFGEIRDKMEKEITGEERPAGAEREKWREEKAATSCGI